MTKPISEALATHIVSVYHAMEENSIEQDDLRIYHGSLSKLIPDLGISMTYYKPIFRTLYDNGYCALGSRGGRDKPSSVILIRPPEKDELKDLTNESDGPIVSLVTRIETIESSLGGLHVVSALYELEKRLVALEEKESKTSGKVKK